MRRGGVLVCVVALCAVVVLLMGWRGNGPEAGLFDHRDRSMRPIAVIDLGQAPTSKSAFVSFHWDDPNWCPDQFVVTAEETAARIVVSDVRIRQGPVHVVCFRGDTPEGTALAYLALHSPLGSREIVRASDGQALPVRTRP